MTTKEQERAALDKIEKILKTLDEDGWVNIAFKGAVENARRNIEDDFGDSDHDALILAREGIEKLANEKAELQNRLDESNEMIDYYRKQIVPQETLTQVTDALESEINRLRANIAQRNEIIVALADNPDDIAFKNAVKYRKSDKETINQYEEICSTIDSYIH